MKLLYAALWLLTSPTNAIQPLLFDKVDEDAFGSTPVKISSSCKGVDVSKLTIDQYAVFGMALQAAYENVHMQSGLDDSKLTVITSIDDPDSSPSMLTKKKKAPYWYGEWNCGECTPTSATIQNAWELELVVELLGSGHSIFASVSSCSIHMAPGKKMDDLPNVGLTIDCHHKELGKLNVEEGTVLAHAAQLSYNKVHSETKHDDYRLSEVHFQEPKKKATTLYDSEDDVEVEDASSDDKNLKWHDWWWYKYEPPFFQGLWGCGLCDWNDDELTLSGGGLTKDPLNTAWEVQLVKELHATGFDIFKKITKCDIKLEPLQAVTVAVTNQRNLRSE